MQREGAAIAFRRIEGTATFEKVAEIIFEIHQNFNLPLSKLVKTVVDNDSGVIQSFTSYSNSETASTCRLNEGKFATKFGNKLTLCRIFN